MSTSGEKWLTDSSDHELGHFPVDQDVDEPDLPNLEDQDGNI